MSKKKRPTKQQTNPPIKTTVQEPAAKRRYAIIRFIEFDPPKGASPQKKTVLIKTSMTDAEIRELSGNICQIVESAYAEHSYMDFQIPDEWEFFDWEEKIDAATEYLAETQKTFDICEFKEIKRHLCNRKETKRK